MFQDREVSRGRAKGSESCSIPLRKPTSFRCSGMKSELNIEKMMKRRRRLLLLVFSLSNNPPLVTSQHKYICNKGAEAATWGQRRDGSVFFKSFKLEVEFKRQMLESELTCET